MTRPVTTYNVTYLVYEQATIVKALSLTVQPHEQAYVYCDGTNKVSIEIHHRNKKRVTRK